VSGNRKWPQSGGAGTWGGEELHEKQNLIYKVWTRGGGISKENLSLPEKQSRGKYEFQGRRKGGSRV